MTEKPTRVFHFEVQVSEAFPTAELYSLIAQSCEEYKDLDGFEAANVLESFAQTLRLKMSKQSSLSLLGAGTPARSGRVNVA